MGRIIHKTGKQIRPKTAIRGKRFHCATCRKRSPKPVKMPAPWHCQNCLKQAEGRRARPNVEESAPLEGGQS